LWVIVRRRSAAAHPGCGPNVVAQVVRRRYHRLGQPASLRLPPGPREHPVLALEMDEVASLKDHVVARHGVVPRTESGKLIIARKQKDPLAAALRSSANLRYRRPCLARSAYRFLGRSVLATVGARLVGRPGGLGAWTFLGFFASLLPCFPLLMIVSFWWFGVATIRHEQGASRVDHALNCQPSPVRRRTD